MEPTERRALSPLTWCYLALAVVGLVGTWYCNLQFFASDPDTGYFASWYANWASSSAAIDIIVVAAAAVVFMVIESRRLGLRLVWLHVIATFVLAAAFSVPLFLARRQHHLEAASRHPDPTPAGAPA